jgi:hypothetical protein
MITKQPLSARSGREISPEDLRESFSEFDFDEREMKELKADFQQTGQQGVYQAKCSQHASSGDISRPDLADRGCFVIISSSASSSLNA